MAAMDHKKVKRIKKEERDEAAPEADADCSFCEDPLKIEESRSYIKQDPERKLQFLEDRLKIEKSGSHIKQDPEWQLHVDDSEHDFLEDPLIIEVPGSPSKQDTELKLHIDDSENDFLEDPLMIEVHGSPTQDDTERKLHVDGSENEMEPQKKRATWDADNLKGAMEAVAEGMPVRAASKTYRIPRRTLRNHISSGLTTKRLGRKTCLDEAQERELCQSLFLLAEVGYPITAKVIRKCVYVYCENNSVQNPFNEKKGLAGRKWLKLFLQRQPDIARRKAQHMNPGRAAKVSEDPLLIEESSSPIKQDPELELQFDDSENEVSEDELMTEESHSLTKQDTECKLHVGDSENEVYEDTLMIDESGSPIKQDPELELQFSDSENEYLEEPLRTTWSVDFIKENPALNLEEDETENTVVVSPHYATKKERLVQNTAESCGISYQETVHKGIVDDDMEIGTENSTYFSMHSLQTQGLTSEEDSLLSTSYSCSLSKREFHKFSCNFCKQNFSSKYNLIMHVFIHIDGVEPPVYVCKLCGEVFPSNASLNKHLKIGENLTTLKNDYFGQHEKNFDFDREVCNMEKIATESSTENTWETSEKFFNDICSTHTLTGNTEKIETNDNYGTLCTSGDANLKTVVLSRKKPHKCDICGTSFYQLDRLKSHAAMHTGKRHHICNICGKSYTYLSSFNKHILLHTKKKPLKCGVCGKSFTQFGSLQRHSFTHTKMGPHKCHICGESFTQLASLKKHSSVHTQKSPHKCNNSGKSFTELGSFSKNASICSGVKYKCDICSKAFSQLAHLHCHKLIHSGKSPHKCEVCGKSFSQLADFKCHKLIHSGKTPHKCEICCKSFSQLAHLKCHELIHSGKRPHKCDTCGKRFTGMSNLKMHACWK